MPALLQSTSRDARIQAEGTKTSTSVAAEFTANLTNIIVGCSPAHARMIVRLERIAARQAPALIEGETGSGKELAARAIHYAGPRRAGPFVPVNCGAIPDALVESELFGHERGAFTDARRARRGLVAEASGGTLFLDEVDALTPRAQVTLLRFLQDQRFRPVGTTRELTTDVLVIAAANRPLAQLVARNEFRSDLMYRLKVLHLVLPPLRERAGDAELLAEHFIRQFARKYDMPCKTLHPATLAWVRSYEWPGNVRELENWIHREFLMCVGAQIATSGEQQVEVEATVQTRDQGGLTRFAAAKAEAVRRFEHDYIVRALRFAQGNVSRAAQLAGKERRAFGKLMKKYGIARDAALSDPAGEAETT
ncbi:MAG TPA: sigma-54 dependent transcriptional regulator [Burkholderiaceae bacterium]|nr:sigma-54 dependent transcriptional regulator [Burkholderiaceae bacterium]